MIMLCGLLSADIEGINEGRGNGVYGGWGGRLTWYLQMHLTECCLGLWEAFSTREALTEMPMEQMNFPDAGGFPSPVLFLMPAGVPAVIGT